MFGRILKAFTNLLHSGEVERWSPERLAEVKGYLEGKPPETFSREDHHLCIDFLMHRYYPKDEPVDRVTWESQARELKAQVDWNLAHPEERVAEVPEDPDFADWMKATLGASPPDPDGVPGSTKSFDHGNEQRHPGGRTA